ncbi:MAG: aminopeptidase [Erysipelotrichaceae bacterium]|jgi:aspartyl aminopeptidase|nr:aminopeptidase [Erysipelotrichaceae bacterium]MBR3168740.1 aminopeptidase [Erysipelotrichaceae bacterium]MCR5300437.1 aminopeptidase [Erysipelotrichaceae bacterium]
MKTIWDKMPEAKLKKVMRFAEGYKDFLDRGKTEREQVRESIKVAEKYGFKDLETAKTLQPGDKVYVNNRNKSLCLFTIGKRPLKEGMNILGAHIDSPRLDLKQNPLYEDKGLAMLDTHYYGGIKKYQWVAQPLALHGVICKKDGTVVDVCIGEKEDDPVVGISDLLIHLASEQLKKPGATVVEGEDLNVMVGSIPLKGKKEDPVKENVLAILKEKYDVEEADFISAEIEVVPAGKARDYGLDRSMVIAYGQDDKICAYTSLMALMDAEAVPERTACCILVDKEEVGSQGNTGMESAFFANAIAEMLDRAGEYSELNVRRCLTNSRMLSSDVSAGFDPNYPSVFEPKNSAFLGKGIVFNKYTGARGKGGCNDANAEYIAKLRNVMDKNKIAFQTAEIGKVDAGGGGTIACVLANLNMDVIDAGIAVQNMHACYEVSSKADLYEGYLAYKAFLKDMD